jgi:histidine ammonia-lyase
VANAEVVVALEALSAAQALDLRRPLRPAGGTGAASQAIRAVVPFLDQDRALKGDLDAAIGLVQSGELVRAVEDAIGQLD